jgi:hypothetical protein
MLGEILSIKFARHHIGAGIISGNHTSLREEAQIPRKVPDREFPTAEVSVAAPDVEIQATQRRIISIEEPNASPLDLEKVADLPGEGAQLILKTLDGILLRQSQTQQHGLPLLKFSLMKAEPFELSLQFVSRINQLAHANLDVGDSCQT